MQRDQGQKSACIQGQTGNVWPASQTITGSSASTTTEVIRGLLDAMDAVCHVELGVGKAKDKGSMCIDVRKKPNRLRSGRRPSLGRKIRSSETATRWKMSYKSTNPCCVRSVNVSSKSRRIEWSTIPVLASNTITGRRLADTESWTQCSASDGTMPRGVPLRSTLALPSKALKVLDRQCD